MEGIEGGWDLGYRRPGEDDSYTESESSELEEEDFAESSTSALKRLSGSESPSTSGEDHPGVQDHRSGASYYNEEAGVDEGRGGSEFDSEAEKGASSPSADEGMQTAEARKKEEKRLKKATKAEKKAQKAAKRARSALVDVDDEPEDQDQDQNPDQEGDQARGTVIPDSTRIEGDDGNTPNGQVNALAHVKNAQKAEKSATGISSRAKAKTKKKKKSLPPPMPSSDPEDPFTSSPAKAARSSPPPPSSPFPPSSPPLGPRDDDDNEDDDEDDEGHTEGDIDPNLENTGTGGEGGTQPRHDWDSPPITFPTGTKHVRKSDRGTGSSPVKLLFPDGPPAVEPSPGHPLARLSKKRKVDGARSKDAAADPADKGAQVEAGPSDSSSFDRQNGEAGPSNSTKSAPTHDGENTAGGVAATKKNKQAKKTKVSSKMPPGLEMFEVEKKKQPKATTSSATAATATGSRSNGATSTTVRTGSRSRKQTDDDLRRAFVNTAAMNEYLASKWVNLQELKRLEELGIIHYRKGKFVDSEKAAIREHLATFKTVNRLDDEELMDIIHAKGRLSERKDFPKFWPEVAAAVPGRPVKYVKDFVKREYNPYARKGKWTPKEDQLLITAVKTHGSEWAKIAHIVERTEVDCRCRWRDELQHRDTRHEGRWTKEEMAEVVTLVKKLNTEIGQDPTGAEAPWDLVVQQLGGTRTRTQCRRKWQTDLRFRELKRLNPDFTIPPQYMRSHTKPPKSAAEINDEDADPISDREGDADKELCTDEVSGSKTSKRSREAEAGKGSKKAKRLKKAAAAQSSAGATNTIHGRADQPEASSQEVDHVRETEDEEAEAVMDILEGSLSPEVDVGVDVTKDDDPADDPAKPKSKTKSKSKSKSKKRRAEGPDVEGETEAGDHANVDGEGAKEVETEAGAEAEAEGRTPEAGGGTGPGPGPGAGPSPPAGTRDPFKQREQARAGSKAMTSGKARSSRTATATSTSTGQTKSGSKAKKAKRA